MKPLRAAAMGAAAIMIPLMLSTPAQADPVAGCGKGFEVKTVKYLQDLTVVTPDDVIAALDKNGDGFLCIKSLPEPAAPLVAAHDNTTQHNR